MGKQAKTNAVRILDSNKISYELINYDSDGFMDGVSIANKLNQRVEETFKTLVTKGKSGNFFVFVIPVHKELDLKAAAKSVSEKSVELIAVADINKVTGYIRGGCSPIGMKKQFMTVVDASAKAYEKIMFSGGRLGTQIKMSPFELITLINAKFENITI
ncbi:MAG: Cys-tRNA(Pro) deacylase [Ruminococcaceae bacterium]|nr:Cys-tRNA(Pro) deacylase [Oscillospiraceae bacterium]